MRKEDAHHIILEWIGSKKTDIIADQIGFLLSQITPDAECDIFEGKNYIEFPWLNNLKRNERKHFKESCFSVDRSFPWNSGNYIIGYITPQYR